MRKNKTPWTLFWDMCSGGVSKEKWDYIYIEAPEAEASVIFYNRFGHSPDQVSCPCCGSDYSVSESPTFADASAYHRNCRTIQPIGAASRYSHHRKYPGAKYYYEKRDKLPKGWEFSHHPGNWKNYMTVAEYKKQKNVLVITKHDYLLDKLRSTC